MDKTKIMKRFTVMAFASLPLLLAGCAETSTIVYRNPNFDQTKTYRVAVLPFRDAAGHPGSGNALSEIFEATLLASGRFEVVERKNWSGLSMSAILKNMRRPAGLATG